MPNFRQKSKMLTLICIFAALGFGPAVSAGPDQDSIVQPYRDRITLCDEALQEVARQGDVLQLEYDLWMGWRESLIEEITRNEARIEEQHIQERKTIGTYLSVADALMPLGSETTNIPNHGRATIEWFQQRRDRIFAEIAELNSRIGLGEVSFRVGTSSATGQAIDAAIQADADRIAGLIENLNDGIFKINYPGLGWVDGNNLESCIDVEQQKINETLEQIAAGEYSIHLPHLGWVTRNIMNARIETAEQELADLRALNAADDMSINRAGAGWFTRNMLNDWIQTDTQTLGDFRSTISDETFSHYFPGAVWLNANQIRTAITSAQDGIAKVRDDASAGVYVVSLGGTLGGYSTDENRATAALALPDCSVGGPSRCVAPSHRLAYQDALPRIPVAVTTDIEIRQLNIDKLQSWLGAIESHATPRIDELGTKIDINSMRDSEFDTELSNAETRLLRNLDWLYQNLGYVP